MAQSLIFILVSVWILLALLLYIFQSKFVYFPFSDLAATPANAGLIYEEVNLTTSDRLKINCWFVPHERPRATLLFLHGNGGNISHRLDKLLIFNRLGLAVFIIDYRGYGSSEGTPSEQGTYLDADAAWDYLTKDKDIPASQIIIYGESLGGAVATWLAGRHKAGALLLESVFTSIGDMGKHYYPYLPVKLLARIKYPTLALIRDVHCPVLVIHSVADDIVPYSQGRKLYAAARKPKTFLEITGDHNNGFLQSGQIYSNGINEFLTTHNFPLVNDHEITGSN